MRNIPFKLASVGVIAIAALSFIGCPPATEGEGEGEGETGCASSRDCLSGFACDKENDGDTIAPASDPEGVCVRVSCTNDDQCDAGEKCEIRRGICINANTCNPGDPDACTNDGDVCKYIDGTPTCAPPTAPNDCELSPSVGYVAAGGTIGFEAVGVDGSNKLVAHSTFTYAASGGSFTGSAFTAPAAGGAVTVTATANGGATCTAVVNVYAPIAANALRVVVIDQNTRAPIAGAKVAARVDGANVQGVTTADGSFTFTDAADATSLSVFPDGHQWHTLIDPPADSVIYTAAVQTTPVVDGVKGTFDFSKLTNGDGDIKLGLAGMAINSSITDLNFTTIVGETVPTQIEIDGLTPDRGQEVPLPEGLVIGLGTTDFKGDYVALSDKPGQSVAWALGGKVKLSEIGPIISSVTGSDNLDFGSILAAVLPFFGKFDHAVATGLEIDPAPRAAGSTTGFEDVTMTPNTLLVLSAEYDMPTLPCAPGAFGTTGCTETIFLFTTGEGEAAVETVVTDCPTLGAGETCVAIAPYTSGAVVLAGSIVPGQGLVPLGLSAGLDIVTTGGTADGVAGQKDRTDGKILLDYAPPHDGIEGNLYGTVAIALDINQISTSDLGASILMQVSRTLPEAGNDFNGNEFLQSQGGSFTPGTSFSLQKKGNADFYRVNLDDGGEQEWNVWFDGSASGTFNIADLAQHSGAPVAARTVHADVQAFKLGAGYDGPQADDFNGLFSFDGRDIDSLIYYLGGWSSESCKAGGICAEVTGQ
jgi:hypothetical protein